jgi:hypothetical protein
MNEGISLMNVSEVHILDVYFTLGRVDQVIGRAIRHCSHYQLMSKKHPYPHVNVYKYAVVSDKVMSVDINLYRKAEMKYMMIKKVERALKQVAIDCPLNRPGNVFPEEVSKFKDCGEAGHPNCPSICDYEKCNYQCNDKNLNLDHYDKHRKIYKKISRENLDYTTFTNSLAKNEIEYAKMKIKELYRTGYVYSLKKILKYVKNSYTVEKRELFDDLFVFRALQDMIPITENDFNNFKDTVMDKYNRPGYIIYINEYYIFQPFDQKENVPMHYRTSYDKPLLNKLSIHNYLKNTKEYKTYKGAKTKAKGESDTKKDHANYDFESVMEYYDNRPEFEVVGIIDKEASRRKNKRPEDMKDVFKIREKRAKILEKKRGTGIPSLKGAVCATSKEKKYLDKLAKKLSVTFDKDDTRHDICNGIKDKLLFMEKYGTDKNKTKYTYVMIPKNHPKYPFPYNLEDRMIHLMKDIKKRIKFKLDVKNKIEKTKKGVVHIMQIKHNKALDEFKDYFKSVNAILKNNVWTIKME